MLGDSCCASAATGQTICVATPSVITPIPISCEAKKRRTCARGRWLDGGVVGKKSASSLTSEIARVAHLLKQRARPEFWIVETLIQRVHNVEHHVETDQIGQRQRPHRVISAELHHDIDISRRRQAR